MAARAALPERAPKRAASSAASAPARLERKFEWVEGADAERARQQFYERSRTAQGKVLLIGPSLCALSRDQARLTATGFSAALLAPEGSEVSARELAKLEQRGPLFVLVTSDALSSAEVRRSLEKLRLSAVAIDDAQLLARTAHEFRPSFQHVAELAARLKTATLTLLARPSRPELRREVTALLGARDFEHGGSSPLSAGVIVECRAVRGERRTPALLEVLRSLSGPGVVLCASPHEVDMNYAALTDAGLPVCRAHAGMPEVDRNAALARFAAEGSALTLLTTSAVGPDSGLLGLAETRSAPARLGFGRASVRPDLRFVIHFHAPASLEQYAQEIAFIGRDGGGGTALLFYDSAQRSLNESVLEQQRYAPKQLTTLVRLLAEDPPRVKTPSVEWLALQGGQSRRTTERLVALLVDAGIAVRTEKVVAPSVPAAELESAGARLAERLAELRVGDTLRLNAVEGLAEGRGCRQQALLRYFGADGGPCGQCSSCDRRSAEPRKGLDASAWRGSP